MLRWFIAVFTLHFFLSVGVSAFGKASSLAPLSSHAPVAAAMDSEGGPAHHVPAESEELPGTPLQEHALADDTHDLPDDLNFRLRAAPASRSAIPPTRADEARTPSPALDKPHKPPRGGASTLA